jgi:serine/threonine-protein kinase
MQGTPDPTRRGEVLGPYRIDDLLGAGGMASVHLATRSDGARCALKILHRDLARHADVRARFVREAYVANQIPHAGVVRVLGDGVDGAGCPFFVMEVLAGVTVEERRRVAGGALETAEAMRIARDVLDVLDAAHRVGVVHRDVKPENVFLMRDGTLKVLDFGIARLLDGSGATKTGTLMGTPAFMPPEQAKGLVKEIGPRTDLWSVGAMLFTLATGEEVHAARTAQHQVMLAATKPARSLATVMPKAAPELVRIVDTALETEIDRRWPSAVAMRDALSALLAREDLARAKTDRPPAAAPAPAPAATPRAAAHATKPFGSAVTIDPRRKV